jgi:MoaA/NifB/PqqE/SkfB family radical SAM enzyme
MLNSFDVQALHVELTSRCNLSCPHCARTDSSSGKTIESLPLSNLDISTFESALQQLPNVKLLHCCGNYGDMTSYDNVFEFIRIAHSYGVEKIRLYTNGSARNKSYWEMLAKSLNPSDEVVFSIDGLEDTNHVYRIGSVWDKVISNVRTFVENGGTAVWEMLVFSHNEHQVKDAQDLSSSIGVSSFRVKRADRFDLVDTSMILKSKNQLYHNKEFDPNSQSINCKYKEQKWLFLSFEGELLPCCWIGGAKYKKNQSNNRVLDMTTSDNLKISDRNVSDILQSKFYIELQQSWKGDALKTCSVKCGSSIKTSDKYIKIVSDSL